MNSQEDAAMNCPHLPPALAQLVSHLPDAPLRMISERLVSRVLADAIRDGELEILEGREMAIMVEDLQLRLGFGLQDGKLVTTAGTHAAAVIRGPFAAFAWLAAKHSDADSLFFHRLLLLEGDTELGLVIKNLLDATELDALPLPMRRTLKWVVARIPAQPPGAASMPGRSYQ